ncbi:helix-turn-helix transcriptional regulator [Clostridioides sp. ES-W-0016-02]|nr:helix-turn-helix transcriptional regulator [Clostridioides sp. ES-W-0016-02]
MSLSLKQYRKKRQLTQEELSKLTGISQSYISRLEKDEFIHSISSTKIILLSDALEIDTLELAEYFFGKERKHLNNMKKGIDK